MGFKNGATTFNLMTLYIMMLSITTLRTTTIITMQLKRLASYKHFCLWGTIVSYEENEVL